MPTRPTQSAAADHDEDDDGDDLLMLPPGFAALRMNQLTARISRRKATLSPGDHAPGSPRPPCLPSSRLPAFEPRDPARDEALSVHEAGHVLAAVALRVPVFEVSIEPRFVLGRCESEGHTLHGECGGYPSAVVALAGPLAERVFADGSGVLGGSDAAIVERANLSARAREMASAEAGRIVEWRAAAIRELASALRRFRTLDGGQVRELLRFSM